MNIKSIIKTQWFAIVLGVVLTGIFVALQVATLGTAPGIIEALAVATSFTSTWLFVQQNRAAYPLGIVSTSLLSYVFFTAGLFGSMGLNLYLAPTLFYGWYIWGKKTKVERVVNRVWWQYVLATGLTYAGAVVVISLLGGQVVFLDGMLLIGSILAQYLLDRRKWENWVVWTIVNVISVYVYGQAGLYLLAAQFVLFLANAIYGWATWKKQVTN